MIQALMRCTVAAAVVATALAAVATARAGDFTNPTPIGLATDQGAATPYPSVITPTGLGGTISSVTVKLNGFLWQHIADADILLVAPNGAAVVLMSDACAGFGNTAPATFTFSDSNVLVMPPSGCAAIPVNVKPFNNQDALLCGVDPDVFPAPAPPGPSSGGYPVGPQMMSTFSGMSAATAMGQWKLFVFDDCDSLTTLDNGGIQNGWTLTLTTAPTAVTVRSFSARRSVRHRVDLTWRTASETGIAGFNVYRDGPGGTTKVNRSLIGAAGTFDGTYRLSDGSARAGVAYTYRLQVLSWDGTRSWYGRAQVRAR
jgi:hypothetical protein